jgi:hypothetical protein
MQGIFDYVSVGDLWALAIIAAVTAVLAANSNYQRHRALAQERAVPAAKAGTKTARRGRGVAAHA